MKIIKCLLSIVLILFIAVFLTSCSKSSSSSTPPASTGTSGTINGVAAVGTPIVGGNISIVCVAGTPFSTTTDTSGTWQVNFSGETFPCAVEVSGGTINSVTNTTNYNSIAISADTVNVTPLTDLLVANLVGTATPSTWFAGLSSNPAPLASITQTQVNTALTSLSNTLLSGLTQLSANNPITTTFTPTSGNVSDDMLTALLTAMSNTGVSYTTLLGDASTSTPITGFNTALTVAYVQTTSGAFTQADLTGTWIMHGLKTGSASIWAYMTLTIDSSGNVTTSNYLNSTGSTTGGGTGTFTIGSNGVITASGSGSNLPPNLNLTMTSNKNVIAGTSYDSGNPTIGAADLWIFQKVVSGTTYSSADVQNLSFVFHELYNSTTNEPSWQYGTGTTNASGVVTFTSLTNPTGPQTPPSSPGTLSVDSSGNVTQSGDTNFNGFLSADKKTIVATDTTNGSDYNLFIIQITGQTYNAGPLIAGTWTQHFVSEVDFTNSPDYDSPANPNAFWVDETQTVTSGGAYAYSNATSSLSGFTPSSGGTASITSSGTVTTSENSTYNGQMSYDGTFCVGTATTVDGDGNNWYQLIVNTQ